MLQLQNIFNDMYTKRQHKEKQKLITLNIQWVLRKHKGFEVKVLVSSESMRHNERPQLYQVVL